MKTIRMTVSQNKVTRTLTQLENALVGKRISGIRATATQFTLETTDREEIVIVWNGGPLLEEVVKFVEISDIEVDRITTVVQVG